MSAMYRFVRLLVLVFLTQSPLFANCIPLAGNDLWHDSGGTFSQCFDIAIDRPVTLLLDLHSENEERIWLVAPGLDNAMSRTTEHLAQVAAGSYRIVVENEHPSRTLPPFRLQARSAPVPLFRSENDNETEVDPDPPAPTAPLQSHTRSENDNETEVDPDPPAPTAPLQSHTRSENDNETEVDPDPPPPSTLPIGPFCANVATDDHDDSLVCATPLTPGVTVGGRLSNHWGDDRDRFAFSVETLERMIISLDTTTELDLVLYDHLGRRLDQISSARGAPRLVRLLAPGFYYLSVEGAYVEADYTVRVEASHGDS
ncbi:MAG: hypothetical protein AAGD38_08640 [Acidobacteriota bacterium]